MLLVDVLQVSRPLVGVPPAAVVTLIAGIASFDAYVASSSPPCASLPEDPPMAKWRRGARGERPLRDGALEWWRWRSRSL